MIWEPYNTAKQQHLFVELFSVDLASLVWSKRFEINASAAEHIELATEQAKENYSQAAAYYSDQIKQNPENYNAILEDVTRIVRKIEIISLTKDVIDW